MALLTGQSEFVERAMRNQRAGVMRDLHHLFRLGAVGGTTDAQLMAQFLEREDDWCRCGIRGARAAARADGHARLPRRAPR